VNDLPTAAKNPPKQSVQNIEVYERGAAFVEKEGDLVFKIASTSTIPAQ
jgi:hypothetical protein